jgi:dimethylhistidine N-methyltransferase
MGTSIVTTGFAEDVDTGLSASPKYLQSKYFYDARGSRIFQDIMRMPEYYLTDCEHEVFKTHKTRLLELFRPRGDAFHIVELGAGDGSKTRVLLEHGLEKNARVKYVPIDISEEAIRQLNALMQKALPGLDVDGMIGDYFELMESINSSDNTPKVIFFLGSNIGNFNWQESIDFLGKIRHAMHGHDRLFIGFDLKKDPDVILKAYNDPHGHTAAFNLNLLRRINEELEADFELLKFKHQEVYDPMTGTAKSYLVSREKQVVRINGLNKVFRFGQWEPLFMEMSQKYDEAMIGELAARSGFTVVQNFTDQRNYFMNSLWQPTD